MGNTNSVIKPDDLSEYESLTYLTKKEILQ